MFLLVIVSGYRRPSRYDCIWDRKKNRVFKRFFKRITKFHCKVHLHYWNYSPSSQGFFI